MKSLLAALVLVATIAQSSWAQAEEVNAQLPTAPYLLPGAPSFDITISQFREQFNQDNPSLLLNEFRALEVNDPNALILRAATKINENLYASAALERATLKIKSIQITWLPIQGPEQKTAKEKAQAYMSALIRSENTGLSNEQSMTLLTRLLSAGKNKHHYAQTDGALRYVVADNGEKGLTFAVEPVKLTLSSSLENSNQ